MSMRVGDESGRARAEARSIPRSRVRTGAHARTTSSEWRAAWRRFRRHMRRGASASRFLVFMFLACFVGVHFAPDPDYQDLARADVGSVGWRTGSAPTS